MDTTEIEPLQPVEIPRRAFHVGYGRRRFVLEMTDEQVQKVRDRQAWNAELDAKNAAKAKRKNDRRVLDEAIAQGNRNRVANRKVGR